MEQLSTIIQVIGSLITLVILPLLLIKSKAKKADAEAKKTEADNITAYAAEWKELYEKKEKRVAELDAKIDHLYTEITKYRDTIRELSEKNSELAVQNQALVSLGDAQLPGKPRVVDGIVGCRAGAPVKAGDQANTNPINYQA